MEDTALAREVARAGISLSELARRTGLCLSTLWRWAQGYGSPRANDLPRLAQALGCAPEDLIPTVPEGRQRGHLRLLPREAPANDLTSCTVRL